MADEYAGKKILVVDDDRDVTRGIHENLAAAFPGAEVRDVFDGNEAVDAWRAWLPDVVVLDAMLPRKSGFLVLEKMKVRSSEETGRAYVVMITGNSGLRYREVAEVFGAEDFINKPFRPERLLDSVRCGLRGEVYKQAFQ